MKTYSSSTFFLKIKNTIQATYYFAELLNRLKHEHSVAHADSNNHFLNIGTFVYVTDDPRVTNSPMHYRDHVAVYKENE